MRISEIALRPLPRWVSAPLAGAMCGIIAYKFPQVRERRGGRGEGEGGINRERSEGRTRGGLSRNHPHNLPCLVPPPTHPQVQYGYINLETVFRDSTNLSVGSLVSLLAAKIAATSVRLSRGRAASIRPAIWGRAQ